MLGTGVVVTLLGQDLSKLHVSATLSLFVLQLVAELQVALYEHLHLILVHLSVDVVASNLTEVANCNGLSGYTAHLDGVPEGKLVVDRGLLKVADLVIDDTEVDVGEELACHVRDFLMFHVVLNRLLVMSWIDLSQLHVINSNAIVGQSLSVDISDSAADLQELLVLLYGLFVLS